MANKSSRRNTSQLLSQAFGHYQRGQTQLAEQICHAILRDQPDQGDATHLLAFVLHQRGRSDDAVSLLRQRIARHPDSPESHNNLGIILSERGCFDEAQASFQEAIKFNSAYAEAHYNLGNVFSRTGAKDLAIAHFRAALADKPDYMAAQNNLANTLFGCGRVEEAVVEFKRLTSLSPDSSEAWYNLGFCCRALKQANEAIAYLQKAVQFGPANFDARFILGTVLYENERTPEAVLHLEQAARLQPDRADAQYNLGNAYFRLRRLGDAERCFSKCCDIQPDNARARCNLGFILKLGARLDEAAACFEKALELNPQYPEAHNCRGIALSEQGNLEEGIASVQKALEINPDYADARSTLLLLLNYSISHEPGDVFQAHRRFDEVHCRPLAGFVRPHSNDRSSSRKIRVGYLSPDFRRHSVAFFMKPVLSNHDREAFDITLYYNFPTADDVTEELRSLCDRWRDIAGMSDESVAESIRQDRIDILIDLTGHTADNRPLVFARRPAPVQVAWLGYPNTTGLSAIDYRITDRFADPAPVADQFHTERLIRLPRCFSVYSPPSAAPDVAPLPAARNGFVTFGSFNNTLKLNERVVSVWSRILQETPASRLLLKHANLADPSTRVRVQEAFRKHGIPDDRLALLGKDRSQQVHLKRYHDIDIALDPFPYNGTTTTCEALWMGVPVIVMEGQSHAGRVGVSQMTNLGRADLVAPTADAYVDTAVRLASDLDSLAALRRGLRARVASSPLTDAPGITRDIEAAFRAIWEDWCETSRDGG